MACDICGNNREPLTDLREVYQSDDIKQICPGCEKVVNKQLDRVRDMMLLRMLPALIKRFMAERRAATPGDTP